MQGLSASGLLEFCAPGEISWSYAQRAYVPAVPSVGLLRSANLLYATLAHEGELERVRPLVDSVRAEFGLERTVWGVKFQEQKVTWEFYWYDHSDGIPLTVSRVHRALEPYLHLPDLNGGWTEPIWSISVDIDSEVLDSGNVPGVHVYLPRSVQPPVCISYFLGSDGLRLENTYFLFQDHDDALFASIDW
ncbi:MAG: hypothetical protein KDB26_10990, partial [Microthrixaceae bacterium]|nr:hypothetical protein [Microthrixaceae bacterium]